VTISGTGAAANLGTICTATTDESGAYSCAAVGVFPQSLPIKLETSLGGAPIGVLASTTCSVTQGLSSNNQCTRDLLVSPTTMMFSGTVTDLSGRRLNDATFEVLSPVTKSVQTDANGAYSLRLALPSTLRNGTLRYRAVYQGLVTTGELPFTNLLVEQSNNLGQLSAVIQLMGRQSRRIYQNDFDTWLGSEWSSDAAIGTPGGSGIMLGNFGNQSVTLSLAGLPAHTLITGTVDLYLLGGWDGNAAGLGPDIWELRADGGPPLVRSSFTSAPTYLLQHIPFTATHTGATLTLRFTGEGLQAPGGESWGIDNIQVYADIPPETIVADFSATPIDGAGPLQVAFTDRSTVQVGVITSRQWDFGDGTTSTESAPVHTYASGGVYTPTLTVHTAGSSTSVSKPAMLWASPFTPISLSSQPLNAQPGYLALVDQGPQQGKLLAWQEMQGSSSAIMAALMGLDGRLFGGKFSVSLGSDPDNQRRQAVAFIFDNIRRYLAVLFT
jgi:hypothetical protein